MNAAKRLRVDDSSQVGEARRLAASMGRECGLDEVRVEHLSIVVTELATNLVKHAGGGDIIARALPVPDIGIEVLSVDKGAGIANIGESLSDGYSTQSSPGNGLGAIRRLSSVFDIYSKPGLGTAVLSQIRPTVQPMAEALQPLELGVVCLPVATEDVCGDAWAAHETADRLLVMVADGLGHGPFAAEASAAATAIFNDHSAHGPREMIERMHDALRITRGAAVAITEIQWSTHTVRYAGVGNISGRVFSDDAFRNMVSHNGTAGMEVRKIEEFTYAWPENGLLILHSDGVDTHWNLDEYPGLRGRHASLIAGVLYRDHHRVRDDSTVLAIRKKRSG